MSLEPLHSREAEGILLFDYLGLKESAGGGSIWTPFEAEVHCEQKPVLTEFFHRAMGIGIHSFSDRPLFPTVS